MRIYDIFDIFNVISAIITPIMLIYIFLFVYIYGRRFIRTYNKNRIIRFTQEEVKEVRSRVEKLKLSLDENPFELVSLISAFNEFAVGINEGLYDEIYIRMVLGHDMMNLYRKYRTVLNDTTIAASYFGENDKALLPLELLLKKWDGNTEHSYKINNNRRYF